MAVGSSFWGSFWARGAALGSLLGVGAEGWASGVHGQRHSCAERLSGCLLEAPPASNPHSRLRSQGSRATGKRGSNSHPRLHICIAGCDHKGRQQLVFEANHHRHRGDDDHWLGGVSGMGAAKGNLWRGFLKANKLADLVPYALLHCLANSVRRIRNASRVPPHTF